MKRIQPLLTSLLLALAAISLFLLFPDFSLAQSPSSAKLNVIVTILPQAYFVQRIAGPYVSVETLLAPGQSEHSYDPTPKQIAHIANAKLLFRIGIPIEKTLIEKARQSYPNLQIIDTRKGVPLRTMKQSEAHEHANHAENESIPSVESDPHIWMSPRLVKIQAKTIGDALKQVDPASAPDYDKNLCAFLSDLDALDARMAKTLAPVKGRTMFVFHPAFGYFTDAYGLKQASIEIEGKEPGARQLTQLMDRARKEGIKTVFVQVQFSKKSAEAIAHSINAKVITLDPLAYDYLKNMESVARQVAAGIAQD